MAQAFLRVHGLPTEDFDSLVFVTDHPDRSPPYFLRTTAVLRGLDEIGGLWRIIAWLTVIPACWRDPFYDFLARIRYRVFGEYVLSPLS
jgi:predicted DCC family thiol-disulfide oxidoreductase YuxK